jgi:hypothetical protein
MFSAPSEARDRNAPTNANQIRLQTSRIRQEHRPIRYQLPARLSFRQGQDLFGSVLGVRIFSSPALIASSAPKLAAAAPAVTLSVSKLYGPDFMIEIEAVAAV